MPLIMKPACWLALVSCVVLCVTANRAASADMVPYNRAYPVEAVLVPLNERSRLQAMLDQNGVIRLEAGDYRQGNAAQIHVRSGYRIYGLNNAFPDVLVEPGTTGAVLSGIHAQLTFPASAMVTRNNLFNRMTYSDITVDGASLDGNLFLDASNQAWKVNTSQQGYMRGNRIIRYVGHSMEKSIVWNGDAQRKSGGNVFLWMNFLDPRGRCSTFTDLADATLVFLDCESYSAGVDAAVFARGVGRLTLVGTSGNMRSGRGIDADVDALYLQGNHLTSSEPPSITLGPHTTDAVIIDAGERQTINDEVKDSKTALRLQMFADVKGDKSMTFNGDPKPTLPTPLQAKEIGKTTCDRISGDAWERPVFETPPDPAGANWKTGLAGKMSSSAMIQGRLDKEGVVLLGAGTYYLDRPIKLGKGKGLVGSGMHKTVLIALSQDVDLVTCDNTSAVLLCDLTLQGGRNGIYHHCSDGSQLQFYDMFLSHVTIRHMADSGMKLEGIYAWDNNYIDFVNVLDCPHGLCQVADHYGNDRDPLLTYMDKNVFYQCQFIRCGKALDLHAFRNSQTNAWINCLFKDCGVCAAKLVNHSFTMFANCDFIDNAGAPMVSANGSVFLISCLFSSGNAAAVDFVDARTVTAEGCTFSRSNGAGTVVCAGKPAWITVDGADGQREYANRSDFISNCVVDVPVGKLRNAVLLNSRFRDDPLLNARGVVVVADAPNQFLSGVPDPAPRLLRGNKIPTMLSSGATSQSSSTRKVP